MEPTDALDIRVGFLVLLSGRVEEQAVITITGRVAQSDIRAGGVADAQTLRNNRAGQVIGIAAQHALAQGRALRYFTDEGERQRDAGDVLDEEGFARIQDFVGRICSQPTWAADEGHGFAIGLIFPSKAEDVATIERTIVRK